jgi:hypothetical protein
MLHTPSLSHIYLDVGIKRAQSSEKENFLFILYKISFYSEDNNNNNNGGRRRKKKKSLLDRDKE